MKRILLILLAAALLAVACSPAAPDSEVAGSEDANTVIVYRPPT